MRIASQVWVVVVAAALVAGGCQKGGGFHWFGHNPTTMQAVATSGPAEATEAQPAPTTEPSPVVATPAAAPAPASAPVSTPIAAPTPAPTSALPPALQRTVSVYVSLDTLLQEHVVLVSDMTDALLAGRDEQFQAAGTALDANSVDLGNFITASYGQEAGGNFLPLWRQHIGLLLDYTRAVNVNDADKANTIMQRLQEDYSNDLGAFFEKASNGRISSANLTGMFKSHIVGLKAVVDAQKAKDWMQAYFEIRDAEKHMQLIGDSLGAAIAQP